MGRDDDAVFESDLVRSSTGDFLAQHGRLFDKPERILENDLGLSLRR